MLIRGKCHCGNISFSLTWDPDPKEIRARACDCTFGQKADTRLARRKRSWIGDVTIQ